jgi:hypothetical protein
MCLISRRRFIRLTVSKTSLLVGVGCGTVLHPERRGQPAGPLDWKIVALDGIGLLLFFVPGVIAFAVDFNNGTIYLPPDQGALKAPSRARKQLVKVRFPDKQLTVRQMEQILSKHAERDIQLTPGAYQTEELENIDDFWVAADKMAAV